MCAIEIKRIAICSPSIINQLFVSLFDLRIFRKDFELTNRRDRRYIGSEFNVSRHPKWLHRTFCFSSFFASPRLTKTYIAI